MEDIESGQEQLQNGTYSLPSIDPPSHVDIDKRKICLQLYRAAVEGYWEFAKQIYETNKYGIQYNTEITGRKDTALHVATVTENVDFVEQLIKCMNEQDLALRNELGDTAFCLAAVSGNVRMARAMMRKNKNLAFIRGRESMLPIYMAARKGHRKMVWYLYRAPEKPLEESDKKDLFVALIRNDMSDFAYFMLMEDEGLAKARDKNYETALHALAEKSCSPAISAHQLPKWFTKKLTTRAWSLILTPQPAFRHLQLVLLEKIWGTVLLLEDSEISRLIKSGESTLLHTAAEKGNVELLTILIGSYPDIIYQLDDNRRSIFHIAVIYRHEDIFKLIHEIGSLKDVIITYTDKEKNNICHLAAKLPSATSGLDVVPGPALRLQRELLWFKEVRNVVQPEQLEAKNEEGKTPFAIFLQDHKELLKEGDQWMRATATSCMLVATLIATVVFAAGFSVPGGNGENNGQNNGIPVFSDNIAFKVYAIMNALSLILSASSVLSFLSIMTSRFELDDFRWSLPCKLMIGLVTLVISISTMLTAFIASFFLVFNHGNQRKLWVAIAIAVIASLPVILFILQHFRLFMDVTKSTYQSKSFFKPKGSLFSGRFVDSKNSSKEE